MVNGTNDGKTPLKVSRNNKACVTMLLTSIRRGGGRGGEVGGEISNWTKQTDDLVKQVADRNKQFIEKCKLKKCLNFICKASWFYR